MVIVPAMLVLLLVLFMPATGFATADGPDYFKVVGVASNDVLNIRAQPSAASAKIGSIPPDGDGIRNLGCSGGLTFEEWTSATEEEREQAKKARWCRIEYDGIEGWVAGRFLGEGIRK